MSSTPSVRLETLATQEVASAAAAAVVSNHVDGADGDDDDQAASDLVQEFEEKLELKLETAGHEPVDCVCEAVASDKDSVQYECKYQMGEATEKKARIQGKFAMNVPYVIFFNSSVLVKSKVNYYRDTRC